MVSSDLLSSFSFLLLSVLSLPRDKCGTMHKFYTMAAASTLHLND